MRTYIYISTSTEYEETYIAGLLSSMSLMRALTEPKRSLNTGLIPLTGGAECMSPSPPIVCGLKHLLYETLTTSVPLTGGSAGALEHFEDSF